MREVPVPVPVPVPTIRAKDRACRGEALNANRRVIAGERDDCREKLVFIGAHHHA